MAETSPLGVSCLRLTAMQMTLIQCVAIFLALIVWQQRWGTIVDSSWMITEAERYLAGERLYVDLMENNPPFTIWFFLPAIIVSKWTGLTPETGIALYTCLMVIIGLGLSAIIIHRAGFTERCNLLRYAPLFVALFVIFPGIAFTERDQIGAVLFLPLLALMAWRADGRRPVEPGTPIIVATAICGCVLVLFKPYYVFACIAPALYVALRRKSIWSIFAPENFGIAIIGIIYIPLIYWFCPEFISDMLPKAAEIYMGTGSSAWVAARFGPSYVAILLLIWLVAPREEVTPLSAVTGLASVASFAALVYQGKGWAYHAYPAIALGFVAVLLRIAASPDWGRNSATYGRLVLCVLVTACCWRPFLTTQKPNDGFIAAVKAGSTPASTLGLIGSDMAGAHPLTRIVGTRFPSANNSDWLGFLPMGLGFEAEERGDAAKAAIYRQMTDAYLDEKYAEFERIDYDLIVVEDDQPIWTDRVLAQPRFAKLMSNYRPIAADERFTVFKRTGVN